MQLAAKHSSSMHVVRTAWQSITRARAGIPAAARVTRDRQLQFDEMLFDLFGWLLPAQLQGDIENGTHGDLQGGLAIARRTMAVRRTGAGTWSE